jgi:hypothetical protein
MGHFTVLATDLITRPMGPCKFYSRFQVYPFTYATIPLFYAPLPADPEFKWSCLISFAKMLYL